MRCSAGVLSGSVDKEATGSIREVWLLPPILSQSPPKAREVAMIKTTQDDEDTVIRSMKYRFELSPIVELTLESTCEPAHDGWRSPKLKLNSHRFDLACAVS